MEFVKLTSDERRYLASRKYANANFSTNKPSRAKSKAPKSVYKHTRLVHYRLTGEWNPPSGHRWNQ